MKNLTTIISLAALVCAVLFTGCQDLQDHKADLAVSRNAIAFPEGGGTTSISVSAVGSWSAAASADWLTLYQSGETLTVTATANTESFSIRTAQITVSTSNSSEIVEVNQEPMSGSFSVNYDTSACVFDSEGGEFIASVTSPMSWTASLSEVDGWELVQDETAGTVKVIASVNNDAAKTGTLTIACGSVGKTSIALSQGSHADNSYFKFLGSWDVNSNQWYYGGEYYGAGSYSTCDITDLHYFANQLDLTNYCLKGAYLSGIEYNREDETVNIPMGFVCGYVFSGGYYWYIYLLNINLDEQTFVVGDDVTCTLSDDEQTITLSGLPEDYPYFGYVGYNTNYYYFAMMNNSYYPLAPITFTRAAESSSVPFGVNDGIIPVDPNNLPEGVPARLPVGFTGSFQTTIQF